MKKIIIVGGVAGGAAAAARLRRLDEHASIIMFERGEHISYAGCGFPYYIGGVVGGREELFVQTPEGMKAKYNIDVRTQTEVVSIDRALKNVEARDLATGETYRESYDFAVLSPGSKPFVPPIEGARGDGVFTLREPRDADSIKEYIKRNDPKDAVVVGGGFIGVEVAENLTDAGIRVTIVELSNQLLAPFDMDAACEIHGYIKQRGVALSLGCAVNKISWGGGRLALETSRGPLAADMVIMAAGVVPESALASKAGLDVNSRAGIIVDETMRTSDACIYAVGDAVETFDFFTGQASMVPLAGPAAKQARIAADNICGIRSVYDGTQGSAVIKIFGKTAAATGLSEKSAKRLGIECDKQFLYLPDRAAYYPGSEMISMKVVYEKPSGKILGAQVFGPEGAVKRCDALAVAIRAGMDADDLAKLELCYSPPYSNAKDPVNIAGFAIGNALSGRVKNFHWHDVDAVLQEGGATCVDVRDARECREGMIDGFVNIPLGELRDKLGGLDKSKKVYVCCQSGARSYAASRILSQNGFEVYNLCGGYRLYRAVKSN